MMHFALRHPANHEILSALMSNAKAHCFQHFAQAYAFALIQPHAILL
jgi:hypothetical protein